MMTGRRVAVGGPPFPPPEFMKAASISGQSIPSGLAPHAVVPGGAECAKERTKASSSAALAWKIHQ